MLTLINTNRMRPPIAPVGLDYVASAVRQAGFDAELLDLSLAADPGEAMRSYFAQHQPALVGLSFRNVDDSFWPSMAWFVPQLRQMVAAVRACSDAPVVLGGSGFSIFPQRIMEETGADFGIRGDGEAAMVALLQELAGAGRLGRVPGLAWREGERVTLNAPAWQGPAGPPSARDFVDNPAYFRLGGQVGVETKRGCPRQCLFCADVLAKGRSPRLRPPADVASEFEALLRQGVDVLHLCDAEFNLPPEHALAVCRDLSRRRLGERVRWYTYMAVTPFGAELASAMRAAGCVGIDFTGPAASDAMLAAYGQPHRRGDIASSVKLCRENGIAVMLDLMMGGPGETPASVAEGVELAKRAGPDCVGVGLGVRLYPGLEMTRRVAAEAPLENHPGVCRRHEGPVDLLQPVFYVSPALGERPAAVVRDCIAGDQRFFEPPPDVGDAGAPAAEGYNYNDNAPLERAIAAGARGAYWDILRRLGR